MNCQIDKKLNELNFDNLSATNSDDEILQASKAIEIQAKEETLRFGTPLSENQMKLLRDSVFSINTENK